MQQVVSKSQFKAQALELLRKVEEKNQPLVVTHLGKPVVKIIPYKVAQPLESLRGSVIYYQDPNEPVGEEDWEMLK